MLLRGGRFVVRRPVAQIACLLLAFSFSHGSVAADRPALKGRSIVEAIAALEAEDLTVYYSSDLIRPWMTVKSEPTGSSPQEVLAEIVAPYRLEVRKGPYGSLLIVRSEAADESLSGAMLGIVKDQQTGRRLAGVPITIVVTGDETTTSAGGLFSFIGLEPGTYVVQIGSTGSTESSTQDIEVTPGSTTITEIEVHNPEVWQLESIVVSASRYQLVQSMASSFHYFTRDEIEDLPDIGDDPLRAVARLPGTATGGLTAKSNIRGGERDETLVRFDGLRLRNPFHLKDFQSVFSSIDPGIISGMEIYTGGFPASYGDRMSGVIDIQARAAPDKTYHEFAQSLFNTGVLSTGTLDDGDIDWAFAGRRGNLDLLLDFVSTDYGSPSYLDFYGRFGVQATDTLRVTGNALIFNDDITLKDSDIEEKADADYTDQYYWIRFDQEFPSGLQGSTMFAHTALETDRSGFTEKEGVSTGSLRDERSFDINTVQTDWSYWWSDTVKLSAGAEFTHSSGDYDYVDEVEFDVVFLTPGSSLERQREREIHLRPDGDQFGTYASALISVTDRLTADIGMRWDWMSMQEVDENHWSPRLSARYALRDDTALRATWGRFYQFQGIDELQVADGVTEYEKAQRADHYILGLEHSTGFGMDIRLEAYYKDIDRLRPRYENLLNTLILLPELQPDRISIAPDKARARGIEFSLSSRGDSPLNWWASYAWSEVEDKLGGEYVRRSWDQDRAVSGGLSWRGTKWNFSIAGSWHSGWPTTEAELLTEDPAVAITGPRNDEELSDYKTLDFRVSRDYQLPASSLTAFFEVSNVFAKQNDCCIEYEVNDEDGEFQLETEVNEYLPAIPSIGFIWRFGDATPRRQ